MASRRRQADEQGTLFELPALKVEPAAFDAEKFALANALPRDVQLGGMTWAYAGWAGKVYALGTREKQMVSHGLAAYAQHPLMRCVELDRTYYEPLPVIDLMAMAEQVPSDFRFVVKAHEDCVVRRYPLHARYGAKRGLDNPLFLDPAYATSVVVEPLIEGFGDKLGAVLFQFPPQDISEPARFAERLHAFLSRLPKGVHYTIELRNPELLTRAYGQALEASGALHCASAWTTMPSVLAQARVVPPRARNPLFVRWLLRPGERYEEAQARFLPFSRLVEEDIVTRTSIATLVAKAHAHGVPATVLVDNKAEGCAPDSIALLARAIVDSITAEARTR